MVVFPSDSRFEGHLVLGGVPVDAGGSTLKSNHKIVLVVAEGGICHCKRRIVDSSIVGKWHEVRAIVPVDLDEAPIASSDAHESMVFCQMDVVPATQLIGVTDIAVLCEVAAIVFIDISVFPIGHIPNVHVVVGKTEMGRNE